MDIYMIGSNGAMEKSELDANLLEGNELIREGISTYYENQTDEYIFKVVKILQELLLKDNHLLIPIDVNSIEQEGDETVFNIRNVITDDGANCAVAFVDETDVLMGEPTDVLSNNICSFIESVVDMDDADGLLINPWGQSFFLSKMMLQFVLEASPATSNNHKRNNKILEKAIVFATDKHRGQVRKGTTIPYITHLMDTMLLLQRMKADKHLITAGILHDTLEDTDTTWENLVVEFGVDVANLVFEHTQDDTLPWKEKRQKFIDSLDKASLRLKTLVLADKLSNLQSMFRDYNEIGDALWNRFGASKEDIAWYYSEVQDKLFQLQKSTDTAPFYWEMVAIFKDLFVTYWFDGKETIYQKCDNGQCYVMTKDSLVWKPFEGEVTAHIDLIARFQAEIMENQWHMEKRTHVNNKKLM